MGEVTPSGRTGSSSSSSAFSNQPAKCENECDEEDDQPKYIMGQPYEADLGHLPAFYVAGRDMWAARVPLVCFCIGETHHQDRVLRQFGLAQEQPDHVVYDDRLHRIDLCGKVEKNWREEHAPYILSWGTQQQRLCHAPPQIGEMPCDHAYYHWYRLVTRKYVDCNNAKLDIMIESHLVLLEMLLEGSPGHDHVRRVLNAVTGLGGGIAANGQANNRHETESAATATPTISTTPLSTPSLRRRATASPSTSATRGRGYLKIPAPIPHASPQPEVLPPILDASPQPKVPSPTPPKQPSFDLGIDFHLTPPMHPEIPSYPPTRFSAPTLPVNPPCIEPMTMIPTFGVYTEHHYPPTSSSSDPLGPPVGIDTL
ncbi:hypothetical protein SO802_028977 [Lithocarpus litseifolius]|uniref:Aminotransferase-like plant mobile domain-containing protein n=1 Tax=Lithocarpus litseifolius TaxID=425828 RepID=A0AAW2BTC4_9ROSI